MLRIIAFCCFFALFIAPLSAQQTQDSDRRTSQSLNADEAGLEQISKDYLRFSTRLKSLKEAFAARETARVNAYYQQLLDAMRGQINLTMEAGESGKEDLAQMNVVLAALEGHTFDVNNPQAAAVDFSQLDKFASLMEIQLQKETAKRGAGKE
ncbi:MAG: hypothetical protein JNN28_03360 [Saprospiraceae bacterium]|nr:hypothetical protein [Saprospiraceae bacterium]